MNDAIQRMLQRYKTSNRSEAERALKEILQEIALVGLWRGKIFEHAAFYGGTALRILYGLDRFSEDLDFTLLNNEKTFDWSIFKTNVVKELSSYGFLVSFEEKKKQIDTAIQSAFLKTNTMHALMTIGVKDLNNAKEHPQTMIRIKIEVDSAPVLGFDVESIYLREPLPIPIMALKESSLFAGKINAALYRAWKQRVKGRDWYDLIWFLRRNIPLNPRYLKEYMLFNGNLAENEPLSEEKVKKFLINRLEEINLNAAKEDVRPFLQDPSQLDLWSIDFFRHWIGFLRFES